jgi:hypothetical protein
MSETIFGCRWTCAGHRASALKNLSAKALEAVLRQVYCDADVRLIWRAQALLEVGVGRRVALVAERLGLHPDGASARRSTWLRIAVTVYGRAVPVSYSACWHGARLRRRYPYPRYAHSRAVP